MVRRKKIVILVCCFLIVVLSVGSFISFDILILGQGRGFYRYNSDIDLNSGALRKRYYYWIIPVKQKIVSTEFSKMLSECLKTPEKAVWKEEINTVTFTGGHIKQGGRVFSSCTDLVNAIIVAEFHGKLSEEEKCIYLNKARELLKNYKIQSIEDMANEINSLTE